METKSRTATVFTFKCRQCVHWGEHVIDRDGEARAKVGCEIIDNRERYPIRSGHDTVVVISCDAYARRKQ